MLRQSAVAIFDAPGVPLTPMCRIDMFTGQLRCDVQWYRSTNSRLYCQTRQLHYGSGVDYELIYS